MQTALPPSTRSRRAGFRRSDTAPEEMELERHLEAEWRRRSFGRASSADRPSSAMPTRTAYTLPHSFHASYSASCPPTVPATPTRSPRPQRRQGMGPPITPPPLPMGGIIPNDRHCLPNDRHMLPNDRHMLPNDRHMLPNDRHMLPNDRHMLPNDRHMLPNDRHMLPNDRHMLPNDRHMLPNDRLTTQMMGPSLTGTPHGGPNMVGTGFQCECIDDRQPWRLEPSFFDAWCSTCTRKRRESTAWSTLDLSAAPTNHVSNSASLPDEQDLMIPDSDLARVIRRPALEPPSVWDCFFNCHSRVGQRIARKRVEQGVKLYNEQKHTAALKKWKWALQRLRKDNDRFVTLGYLGQAYLDWGRYREMIDCGFQQLDIANEIDSPTLRAEAYLTLARGNERIGNLEKTVSYCRHSLYNQCDQSRTTGYVHLTLGNTYLVYSTFSKSLEHYELSLKVARAIHDAALELQVYCGLANVFCNLLDFDKSLSFSAKSFELSKSFQICDLNAKYQRLSLITLATPLRKLGRLHEARDCCQDALKMAVTAGDRQTHARCLAILADIHRQCLDVQRAYKRYESSMQLMLTMGDKYGQLVAMNGIAKTLGLMRKQSKICDCKPIKINNKVIDQASALGCKLQMRSAHTRLAEIYRVLQDDDNETLQTRLAACLTEEMELICGVCRTNYGEQGGNSLDALPCSHIFHAKCVRDIMSTGTNRKRKRLCPDCRKSLNSRLMLICYDELKAAYATGGANDTFPRSRYNGELEDDLSL